MSHAPLTNAQIHTCGVYSPWAFIVCWALLPLGLFVFQTRETQGAIVRPLRFCLGALSIALQGFIGPLEFLPSQHVCLLSSVTLLGFLVTGFFRGKVLPLTAIFGALGVLIAVSVNAKLHQLDSLHFALTSFEFGLCCAWLVQTVQQHLGNHIVLRLNIISAAGLTVGSLAMQIISSSIWPAAVTFASLTLALAADAFGVFSKMRSLAKATRATEETTSPQKIALLQALKESIDSHRGREVLLANISHELRTPLNAIVNVPETLLGHFVQTERTAVSFEGDGDDFHRMIGFLESATTQLSSVIADLKAVGASQNTWFSINKTTVAVSELLQSVSATMTPSAERKNIQLHFPTENFELTCDALRIKQVLINLLGNAIKFSPPGGHIHLDIKAEKNRLTFTVTDSGPGIAPEHQALIFERFQQVNGPLNDRHRGTGLGLTIAQNLVTQHGGTLTVASAVGQGSSFSFWLPL